LVGVKKMNKHSKGTHYELEARKLLEAQGYLVEKKNYNRWASKDFYGLFDILAIGPHTKLIQVKTNSTDFYKARKGILEWMADHPVKGVIFEIWLKEPRKAWRCEKMTLHNARRQANDKVVDIGFPAVYT